MMCIHPRLAALFASAGYNSAVIDCAAGTLSGAEFSDINLRITIPQFLGVEPPEIRGIYCHTRFTLGPNAALGTFFYIKFRPIFNLKALIAFLHSQLLFPAIQAS